MSLLLKIPNEILLLILEELTTEDLLSVEKCCWKLWGIASSAYAVSYGPEPVHRDSRGISYRTLAIEQMLAIDVITAFPYDNWSVEDGMDALLDIYYLNSNESLMEFAKEELLRAGINRDNVEWLELVATLLLAQSRYGLALGYYEKLTQKGPLPERTFLSAARFGWPFKLTYPDTKSEDLARRAFLGAAAAGNLDLLTTLHNRDLQYDICGAINVAAQEGQTKILEYLHTLGQGLSSYTAGYVSPLFQAAQFGHIESAKYILQQGIEPTDRDISVALTRGMVDMFDLLTAQKRPYDRTYSSDGDIRLRALLGSRFLPPARICEVLTHLERGGVDMNGIGHNGESAITLAAGLGNGKVLESVLSLGANIHAIDKRGISAFETAVVHGHTEHEVTLNSHSRYLRRESMNKR